MFSHKDVLPEKSPQYDSKTKNKNCFVVSFPSINAVHKNKIKPRIKTEVSD